MTANATALKSQRAQFHASWEKLMDSCNWKSTNTPAAALTSFATASTTLVACHAAAVANTAEGPTVQTTEDAAAAMLDPPETAISATIPSALAESCA